MPISQTIQGIDRLWEKIAGRPVDALLANAGRGLGKGFLDQNFDDVMRVVNTNITGTNDPADVARTGFKAMMKGERRCRYRLAQQAAIGHCQRDPGCNPRRTTPQKSSARFCRRRLGGARVLDEMRDGIAEGRRLMAGARRHVGACQHRD
jgi:hypothetical protein